MVPVASHEAGLVSTGGCCDENIGGRECNPSAGVRVPPLSRPPCCFCGGRQKREGTDQLLCRIPAGYPQTRVDLSDHDVAHTEVFTLAMKVVDQLDSAGDPREIIDDSIGIQEVTRHHLSTGPTFRERRWSSSRRLALTHADIFSPVS